MAAVPGTLLQKLTAAVQYIPVVLALSQSTDPQLQLIASSFSEVPFVILHAAYLLHVLSAATQYIPVPLPLRLLVQALFPQIHSESSSTLLGADPSVIWQAGAVRVHKHMKEDEQDIVEEVSVLKYRIFE